MDRISTPSVRDDIPFTASMLRRGVELLIQSSERVAEKRKKYYDVLTPILNKLRPRDYDGILAVVKLVQSGFYEPLHPDDAKWCLDIVRDRGLTEFDR